jgi:hypothetical protein
MRNDRTIWLIPILFVIFVVIIIIAASCNCEPTKLRTYVIKSEFRSDTIKATSFNSGTRDRYFFYDHNTLVGVFNGTDIIIREIR